MQQHSGHTLIELVIVVALIAIAVALAMSQAARRSETAGGGERVLRELRHGLEERRSAAIRLQPLPAPTSLESYSLPPVEIDFTDLVTTAPLDVDNTNVNGNSWSYVYTGDAIVLPAGWQVVASSANAITLAGSIPLIAGGSGGRGVLVTKLGFNGGGLPEVWDGTIWRSLPAGSPSGGSADPNAAPFWALYAISGDQQAAVAVAVHPGGVFEDWRWTGGAWQGFQKRGLN